MSIQQKIAELENQISVHKEKHHRDGCCYSGTNGCCDAEELISNKLRLQEILKWPNGTPNVNPGILDNGTPGIELPLGRYHYPRESDKDFLRRMEVLQ